MTGVPSPLLVVALAWLTLLIVAGGLALIRARDILQRVVALDLIASVIVALLALLSYARRQPYYMDAAVALALLSFVATLAVARHLEGRSPVE